MQYAAFRIIPYYPHYTSSIEVTKPSEQSDTDSNHESDEDDNPSSRDEAIDDDTQPIRPSNQLKIYKSLCNKELFLMLDFRRADSVRTFFVVALGIILYS